MATFLDTTKHKTPLGEYPTVDVPDSWPEPHLTARPRDTLGEKIIAYAAKWRDHPNFPPSHWDDRTGTISLIPPNRPRPDTDPIPRYRMKEDAFLGPNLYSKGQEIDHAGWPARPSTLEPMNESAERVLDYMARCAPGRTLPGMPHTGGVLSLPSPALQGAPQPFEHRGHFGGPSLVA
jgi:hypothetical protein